MSPSEPPSVLSVIIPTRNRATRLQDLLSSLERQAPVPFEWEVLVVDNGSEDDTAALLQRRMSASRPVLRHVRETNVGLHCGRNRGAREALGRFVAYLDDDMVLDPHWILGVESLIQGKAEAVVGQILPKWECEPAPWLSALDSGGVNSYLGLLDLGAKRKSVDALMVFGGNSFFPRNLILELGGFHPDGFPPDLVRFRGDGENGLMTRFRERNLRALYDPRALAYHVIGPDRMTLDYLTGRAYRQGISDSFTEFRRQHLAGVQSPPPSGSRSFSSRMGNLAIRMGGKIRSLLEGKRSSPEMADLQSKLQRAWQAGWTFHRDEIERDPHLRRYVLRPNYLD